MTKTPNNALAPGLYIVATPIGHPGDITMRALDILRAATVIACEDTRVTDRLLRHYGIHGSMIIYNDHATEQDRSRILTRIGMGEAVALVSDAGTPLISDPGYKLVRAAQEADYLVVTIPGPSACIAALTLSGLPTDRFAFEGFLPATTTARKHYLHGLLSIDTTFIWYESPKRLSDTLADMEAVFGDSRQGVVVREMTKSYEEVIRGSFATLVAHFEDHPPRGEIVLLAGPPSHRTASEEAAWEALLITALQTMSVKEAVAHVAAQTPIPRRVIYAKALQLSSS